jgi:transcriptional regulator with GAF, ATPase, and Fis domain
VRPGSGTAGNPAARDRLPHGTIDEPGETCGFRLINGSAPRSSAAGTEVAVRLRVDSTGDQVRELSDGAHPPGKQLPADTIVFGHDSRMRAVFEFLRVVADSDSNVLIIGETGTGKELVARFIHQQSRRRHRPFVAVSCAILTETIIESELFGHERGVFTGAVQDRPGRFEIADRGTIFLDDVDDVPLAVQVKLLRVLQQRTVERVGGTRTIPVDVRVVAAAKRSLRRMVAQGGFRQDLFYRLNVLPIWLPPLRERRGDIPLLTDYFLARFRGPSPRQRPVLTETVRDLFQRYPWPGNVRELENACERIARTCACTQVRCACMPSNILFHRGDGQPERQSSPAGSRIQISLDDRLAEVEGQLIAWALTASHGNRSKAADLLQIKRSTLGDRIRRLGLERVGRRVPLAATEGGAL